MLLNELIDRVLLLWKYLLKKWYVAVLTGLVGAIGAIVYVWQKPPVYEAQASFAIDEKAGGLSGALGLAAELGFNIGGGGRDVFSGENIVYILQSKRIVEKVLLSEDTINGKRYALADLLVIYQKNKGKFNPAAKPLFPVNLPRNKFSYKQDSLLFEVQRGVVGNALKVGKPDKKFNIYELSFASPNERFSKIFAERLIEAASNYYTDIRTQRSRQTLQVLENRVSNLRNKASSSIQAQASSRDANLNPAFAKAAADLSEKQIDLTAYGKAYEELFRNMELARYQLMNDLPIIQIIDPPAYPLTNKKMGRLKAGVYGGFVFGFLSIAVLSMLCFLRTPMQKV